MCGPAAQPIISYMAARIGFVGVGTMASAMVEGLCTLPEPPVHVYLSPRSQEHTTRLAAQFPTLCTPCTSIQQVVDNSDWVVIALPPTLARQVLPTLTFKPTHLILTVMAGIPLDTITQFVSPASTVVYAMPMPSVAHHRGLAIVRPRNAAIQQMLDQLGAVFSLESGEHVDVLQAVACLMGPVYQMMATASDWMEQRGVERNVAQRFAREFLASVSADAVDTGKSFRALVEEQTPGGINEGAIASLQKSGAFDGLTAALEQNLVRVQGNSRKDL